MVKSANLFFAHWAFPSRLRYYVDDDRNPHGECERRKNMYNRFAAARRRYLREYRDGIYTGMLLTGKLTTISRKSATRHRRCSIGWSRR